MKGQAGRGLRKKRNPSALGLEGFRAKPRAFIFNMLSDDGEFHSAHLIPI